MTLLFTPDQKLFQYLPIVLKSILTHLSGKIDHVYLLSFDDLDLSTLPVSQVTLIKVDREDMRGFITKSLTDRLTLGAWLRILAPRLLPIVDKVLYLDIDIVVENDLRPLWIIDLEDKPFAAVRQYPLEKGLQEIQSGVLLMNLKRLREIDFEQLCLSQVQENERNGVYHESLDQGVITQLFSTNYRELPWEWNFTRYPGLHNFDDTRYLETMIGDYSKIAIFHYAGPTKPWTVPWSRWYKYTS